METKDSIIEQQAAAREAQAGARDAKPELGATQPQPAAAPVSPVPGDGWSFAAFGQWVLDSAGVNAPSWTRGLITFGVVCLGVVGVAMAGSALTAFLAAGAMSMGIGAFITWIITVAAWGIVIYYGGGLCIRLAKYFLEKRVDTDIASIRDTCAHAVTPTPKYPLPVHIVGGQRA